MKAASKHPQFVVLTICIGIAIVFQGCVTSRSIAARHVQEADAAMMAECRYLGEVHGISGWGNLASSVGITNAKNEALEKAAGLGGSHVVWNNLTGGFVPSVSGKAYRCDGRKD